MDNKQEIQRNFGSKAENYRLSSVHGNPVDLDRMVEILQPGKEDVALDVATGAGHTAIKLAAYASRVVAIDLTPEMLAQAAQGAREQGISNIEFLQEDVHHLIFPDASFDIVVSRFAVHHFFQVKEALTEMLRVLKPGGKLYILDCSTVDGEDAEREMNRLELIRDSSHVFSYSPRLWGKLLAEHPLTIERLTLIRDDYKIPQWFDRMGAGQKEREEIYQLLENLPEHVKADYPYQSDFITTYRVEIFARKAED